MGQFSLNIFNNWWYTAEIGFFQYSFVVFPSMTLLILCKDRDISWEFHRFDINVMATALRMAMFILPRAGHSGSVMEIPLAIAGVANDRVE